MASQPAKAVAGKVAGQGGADRAADNAVAQAKSVGAVGPYGSDVQRSLRDSAIIARASTGTPHQEIADEFGIATRTVRSVLKRAKAAPSPLDQRPMELVEALARGYGRLIADFRLSRGCTSSATRALPSGR